MGKLSRMLRSTYCSFESKLSDNFLQELETKSFTNVNYFLHNILKTIKDIKRNNETAKMIGKTRFTTLLNL